MDAKVDDWVVTPRIGKPIEINALWYGALKIMSFFASELGKDRTEYERMAARTQEGFARFWQADKGYCYDVLDTPNGNDGSLRPNQIFAVSLPPDHLLTAQQEKAIVDTCALQLLTSYGLRSLSPDHPDYKGKYGGDRITRDGAYHQGTVWGWLLGAFVEAHLKVYQNPQIAKSFLKPMFAHLQDACLGSLSEIFDGDIPFHPRGAFAQAWSVGEILRVWFYLEGETQ
jgi:predicted glycogen debranching enzyme